MSLQFSDTTNKGGILQKIERLCKLGDGGITGNTQRLKDFTSDVNLALDEVTAMIFTSSGTWQYDDSNHTDYPIITTNIIQGQRDYTFTTDEQGNLILDIYKVLVKNTTAGKYEEIYPVDVQSDYDTQGFTDGEDTEGNVYRYDKTGNGIFLDQIPQNTVTNGLKIYINRESSYFATTDTTKKPGFAGLFHMYLALKPAFEYAYTNQLENKNDIKEELVKMESDIKKYYRDRSKDETPVITSKIINSI